MTDSSKKFSYQDIATAAKTGFDWISKVCDPKVLEVAKQKNLKVELCKLVNEATAASEVLPTNISLGVFGASQAGKSYLVSTLAAIGDSDLTTKKDGTEISFFKHLNPEGNDYEATGIVTRFTRNEGKVPEKFPFKVKLFDEIDLVNVLANAFFKDLSATLKTSPEYDASNEFFGSDAKINEFFDKELKAERYQLKLGEESYVKNNQIVFLAEYVKKVALGNLEQQSATSLFWTRACEVIETLNFEGRKAIYSKLWGGLKAFDYLLEVLGPSMQKLKGAHEAYVPIKACVQVNGEVVEKRKGGTLLDIGVLTRMFEADKYTLKDNSDSMIEVALDLDATEIVEVPFAVLTFATREIAFPLPEDQAGQASRCGNFDVLDFPGARSRKGDDIALLRELGKADISEYLRRGKVAYLFESYSKRHEIDLLLWCIGVSKQQEVTEPQIKPITDWVYENVGKTPEERAKFGCIPLIGAFTRFDTPLTNALPKAEDGSAKIKTEVLEDIFKKALENFKTEWLDNWANGKIFNQFFCVRRPNISASVTLFAFKENTTIEDHLKVEESLVKALLDEYKQHIAITPESKYLYEFNEETHYAPTLDEVLKPSDGGVTYLAQFVKANFANHQKNREKVKSKLSEQIKTLKDNLNAFTNSFGQQEKIELQRAEGQKMVKALNQCETLAGTLADIRHFIEIDADKALDDYNNNRTDGISNNAYRFAKALTTFHFENLNYISKGKGFDFMFKNLWRCYDKNKQKAMASEDDLEQKYSFFVDEASSSSEKTIITDEKKLKEKFQNLLIKFTTELEKAYNNLNVEQVVVNKLLPYEDQVTKKYNLAQGQTERALTIISDFNTYLSFDSTKLDIGRFDEKYNFVKKTELKNPRPLFHEITDYVKNEVKGDSETFDMYLMPDFSIYKENTEVGVVDKFGEHYYQDYFSVLLDLMVTKNVTGQSLYKLTDVEDDKLCEILNVLANPND